MTLDRKLLKAILAYIKKHPDHDEENLRLYLRCEFNTTPDQVASYLRALESEGRIEVACANRWPTKWRLAA